MKNNSVQFERTFARNLALWPENLSSTHIAEVQKMGLYLIIVLALVLGLVASRCAVGLYTLGMAGDSGSGD